MKKLINIVVFSLSVVGALLWIVILGSGSDTYIGIMFFIAYVLLAIPLITGVFFAVRRFLESPETLKRVLLLLLGALVVVGISYLISDDTPVKGASGTVSSWVDTGLYVFYIQAFAVVVLMLYFSVRRVTTKK